MSSKKQLRKLRAHLDDRLRVVDLLLEQILLKLDQPSGTSPVTSPVTPPDNFVSDADWHRYMGTFPGDTRDNTDPPQVNSGMTGKKLTDGTSLGRVYSQTGSIIERWVLNDPASIREQTTVQLFKIDDLTPASRLADTSDLGTGYIANSVAAARHASNAFDYLQIPSSGPGTPPPGTLTRYYTLSELTIDAGGNTTATTDMGRLYREIHTDSNGREVWSDHYVLYAGYNGPKLATVAAPRIDLQIDRQTTGIPASVSDFLTVQRAKLATEHPTEPNAFKYAHVFLTWNPLPSP